MGIIQNVKRLFKKGGYALTGLSLVNINDHPKINIETSELERIDRAFKEYRNDYSKIKYVNSNNKMTQRDYVNLNMRKMTAEMMASLVYSEQVEVKVDIKEADEFIRHVFEHNDFNKNMARYLEPMFVAGGLAVRPYVDSGTGEVEFSWALANAFYPLRSNSKGVSEGVLVFKTTVSEGSETVYYNLLEFHEWVEGDVQITNELYRSNKANEIGKRVALGHNGQYEGLEPTATIIKPSKPNFNYVKPSGFNNFSVYSPLGVGICDNAISTLKQINDTYDQFNWEIQMGQRTVVVSDHVLNYIPDEQGNTMTPIFDPSINVFKPMRMDSQKELIKDITNDIRTTQYMAAMNQFFKTLEMQMQLSIGTFSFDGKSVKTATEVVSENSLTFRTRNMQCNEVEKFIKGLVVSVLELAKQTIYNGKSVYVGDIPKFEQISVNFDDGVFESADQKLDYFSKAKTAGLVPITEAIKSVFNLTDKKAIEWYKRMKEEELGLDPTEYETNLIENKLGAEE